MFNTICHQGIESKIIWRYHFLPIRMAEIQNTDNIKCWQGCGAIRTLILCWWEYKLMQPLRKAVCQFLKKLTILLSHDPAVTVLGFYPNELKSYVYSFMQ